MVLTQDRSDPSATQWTSIASGHLILIWMRSGVILSYWKRWLVTQILPSWPMDTYKYEVEVECRDGIEAPFGIILDLEVCGSVGTHTMTVTLVCDTIRGIQDSSLYFQLRRIRKGSSRPISGPQKRSQLSSTTEPSQICLEEI